MLEKTLRLEPSMDLVKSLREWGARIHLFLSDTGFIGAGLGELRLDLRLDKCLES